MAIHVRSIDPAETATLFDTLMTAFLERSDPAVLASEVHPVASR